MDTSVGPAQLGEGASVSPSGLVPGPLGPWDAASVWSLPPFTHAPGPASPFLLTHSSAGPPAQQPGSRHLLFPRPPEQGVWGALAIPLSRLALPPHMHECEWPENTSPGCPDQLLPTLGTPMPTTPPLCFRAVPWGQDQAVQMEARPGPGRSPLRGAGELARWARPSAGGSDSANPGPWTASWPFYRCEKQVQGGPGPWCLARNSMQHLVPNTEDPARPVQSGCWHRPRGSGGPGVLSGALEGGDPPAQRHPVSQPRRWQWAGARPFWQWRACFAAGIHGSVGRLGGGVASTCLSLGEDRSQGPGVLRSVPKGHGWSAAEPGLSWNLSCPLPPGPGHSPWWCQALEAGPSPSPLCSFVLPPLGRQPGPGTQDRRGCGWGDPGAGSGWPSCLTPRPPDRHRVVSD